MSIWHPRRRILLASFLALVLPLGVVLVGLVAAAARPGLAAPAQQAVDLFCNTVPIGALPPARPVWCEDHAGTGPPTFQQATNAWVDDWESGVLHGEIGAGYRLFENLGSNARTQHFRHDGGAAGKHWMVDIAGTDADGEPPWREGGAMLRPDRSFRFHEGTLVVEADVAAGIAEYEGNAWPELVVSTAPAPTGNVVDGLYAYGQFGGQWAVGCRLQASRSAICALYEPGGVRVFEISHFQHEGAQRVYGGEPGPPGGERDLAWRVCAGTDPDTNCRDRFRWELTRDTLTLYVNGVKYMEHAGLPAGKQLPDAMVNGEVYVYFADWIFKPDPSRVVRYHWDRTAVNPLLLGTVPTATPSPTGTVVPPTATPTVAPSASPTATPSPTATAVPPTQTTSPTATTVPATSTAAATATPLPGNVCETALIDGGVVVYRRPAGCVLPTEGT